MDKLWEGIMNHWEIISLAGAYVFLAFVSSLPEPGDPRPVSQKIYGTFYMMLHLLSNKVIEKKPGLALPKDTVAT